MGDPTKNKSGIKRFSGGILCVCPIADEDAGGAVGDAGNWINLGYVGESILEDMTEVEDHIDETGSVVSTDEGQRTVKLTGTLMQSDPEIVYFFQNTCRGNFYMVYHYDGLYDGKDVEYWFGICKIKPQIRLQSGEKRIPFEISVLKNASAINFGDTGEIDVPTEAKETAYDETIPAEEYYIITEDGAVVTGS